METSRTKLSMSIASFSKLRENDLLYIDKTRFIQTLEDLGIRHALLMRPRRFGKSLFLSTLETYYDRNEAESFDRYFAGTFIGAHPTTTQGQYAVLHIDFSGISYSHHGRDFCANLVSVFYRFYDNYKLEALRPLLSRDVSDPSPLMRDFFSIVAKHLPLKLMLLIDEYDHMANVLLKTGPNEFAAFAEREEILRRFYAEIEKAAATGIVARSFIIGVSRLAKYPVAAGFISAQDITEHEAFADLCGFTTAELRNVVETTMTDKTLTLTDDELVNRITDAYSGYRFSPTSDITVVNPEACIHYLCYWNRRNCEAIPVKPPSIRTQEDIMDAMLSLGGTTNIPWIVSSVIQGIPLPAPAATASVGSKNRKQLSNDERLDLLRCMGFLTYDATTSELVVPNKYMAEGFDLYFLKRITGASTFSVGDRRAKEVAKALTQGDIRPLFERITKPLRNEADHPSIEFSDEFILKTAARALINLCTDYRLETCGDSGFRLIPITENAPTYWVEMATVEAGVKTTDAVSRKLTDAEEKLKQTTELHPLAEPRHLIKVAAVFSDFELVALESC